MDRRHTKRERRRLIEARTEREQAEIRASLPFDREQMEELLNELSRLEPAADAFGNTRLWLARHGFPVEPVLQLFEARGLGSDAELLLEANPYGLFGPSPRRLVWMPIDREPFAAMQRHLNGLDGQGLGCDRTSRHTAEWLSREGMPVRETLAALRALGGWCDCEIAGVASEEIYPAALALVKDPPPKPKRPADLVRPTEYRDEALVFPLPSKPWYRQAETSEAPLVLVFGKGFRKPELRLLSVGRPEDEAAWCRERWQKVHLDRLIRSEGETSAQAATEVQRKWLKQGRGLVGPESVSHAGVSARWFTTRGTGYPVDTAWCMLELPGGFRVVELVVGLGTWDPFGREARKLVATMVPA